MKLSARLMLAGVVAPVTALAMALAAVGVLLDGTLRDGVDRALLAQAAVESVSLFDRLDHAAHLHVDRSPLRAQAAGSPAWGALYGPDGARLIAVPDDAPTPARVSLPPLGAAPRVRTEPGPRAAGQRVLLVTVASPEGRPHALRLALPLDRHRETMASYVRLAGLVGAMATAVLLALQTGVMRALRRRIAVLGAHVARLRRGDLGQPPDTDATDDELSALRDAIADATNELREARDARERLLADAAHELRTPLAAIRTDIDVTLRRERDAVELREALSRVREEATRLGALAQQLLELAASRRRPLALDEGDLGDAVRASVAVMGALASERKVTLAVDGAARGRFDQESMQQVLVNLVDNALRFSPEGATVGITAARTADGLSLAVDDEGPGVAEEERRLIFEPFHRVDRSGRGAGLGLSIVRDIARRHGGEARVEAGARGGARFVVTWPG